MSKTSPSRPLTPPAIRARKGGEPIICLTSYTRVDEAALVDPSVDLILVGDSLAMTVYGMASTIGVTTEMMIAHGWKRGGESRPPCLRGRRSAVPASACEAFAKSFGRVRHGGAQVMAETGCAAVKLEGGAAMAGTIGFLTARGVPVMAHIGLTPQSVNALGGYPVRGRGEAEAAAILADAVAVAAAGAFSVVIEKTAEPLAREITARVAIPTIGIGASPSCDGQILVIDDLIGLFTAFRPKFARRYAEAASVIEAAVRDYAADVRARRFPGPEHVFSAGPPGGTPG